MITLLRKLFIKNYKNIGDTKVRAAHGKLAAWFGVFTNILLFGLKIVFGIIASSISLIGDAINNLSDMGTSVITLVGFKLSSRPADKEHPFGYQRIEYIAGLIVSIVIVALAVILGYSSVSKIIDYFTNNLEVTSLSTTLQYVTFGILFIAVLFKILQGLFYYSMGKVINSVTLKANTIDSFTDALATLILLIAQVLSYFLKWYFLDGFMGVLVAIFIAINGIKMIKETSSPLIGSAVSKEDVEGIVKDVLSYEGILGVHDLLCHMYGPTNLFISLHAEISAHEDILVSHDLIDLIEHDIKKKYGCEIVIHMDPIDNSNPDTLLLKEKVIHIIKSIDEHMSIHDFRAVHGTTHTNIIFDIVVPFENKITNKELISKIQNDINVDSNIPIMLVVNVDRPFVK